MTERDARARPALLVALLALVVYLPSVLVGGFLQIDDDHYVVHSPAVAHFEIARAFDPRDSRADLGAEYLPVRDLTYMIDATVFGVDSPRAFRAMSLVYYAIGCALAYLLLLEVTGKAALSFVAAAFFAVHPVHAESVAWIASRKDVLSGLFGFGALLAHSRKRLLLGVFLSGLAVLSKSTLLCLPLLVPLVERRVSWRVLPYVAVAGIAAWNAVDVGTRTGIAHPLPQGGLATVFMTDAPILVHYVALSLVPIGCRVSYATFPLHARPDELVLGTTGALALIALLLAFARAREARLGALWFALALTPVLNLKPGAQWIADRYLFVPSLGACLILARVVTRIGSRAPRLSVALASLLLASFALLGLRHGLEFANDERLFRANLSWEPENPIARHQLARGLLAKAESFLADGKPDTAAAVAKAAAAEEREALRLMSLPGVLAGPSLEARISLARDLEIQGEFVPAIREERLVLALVSLHADERTKAEARQRAARLGTQALKLTHDESDVELMIEAAHCFAFAHEDGLARSAIDRASETAPDLVEQAVQQDPELERAVGPR